MNKQQTKKIIRLYAVRIRDLERQQAEYYNELVHLLDLDIKGFEDDGLWDYCFNDFGNLENVIKELNLK